MVPPHPPVHPLEDRSPLVMILAAMIPSGWPLGRSLGSLSPELLCTELGPPLDVCPPSTFLSTRRCRWARGCRMLLAVATLRPGSTSAGPRADPEPGLLPGGRPSRGRAKVDGPLLGGAPAGGAAATTWGVRGPSRASATGWDCSGPPGDESTGTFHEPVTTCAAHDCRVAGPETHTQWTQTFKSIFQWGPKFAFHPSDMGLLHSGHSHSHRDTGTESKPRGHTATGTHGHRDTDSRGHRAKGTQSQGDTDSRGHKAKGTRPRGHTATRTHSNGDMETWGQIQSHRHSHTHTSGQAQPLRSPICHPKGNVRGILSWGLRAKGPARPSEARRRGSDPAGTVTSQVTPRCHIFQKALWASSQALPGSPL